MYRWHAIDTFSDSIVTEPLFFTSYLKAEKLFKKNLEIALFLQLVLLVSVLEIYSGFCFLVVTVIPKYFQSEKQVKGLIYFVCKISKKFVSTDTGCKIYSRFQTVQYVCAFACMLRISLEFNQLRIKIINSEPKIGANNNVEYQVVSPVTYVCSPKDRFALLSH